MNAAEDPMPIVRPALLVYAFVPIDDDPARFADGWRYLTRLWDACRAMGMTDPLLGPVAAAELPAAPPGPGAFQVLVSARRGAHGAGVRAAFLFVEHDTVGLVAAVSADHAGVDGWSAVLDEWLLLIADSDAGTDLLGEVLVLVGYTPDGQTESPSLDHDVGPLASRLGADATAHPPTLTSSGIRVWEFPVRSGRRRMLAMLAPEQREAELDEWTWAVAGHQGLMPFTRYCLHVAKGHYQAEVYRRMRPVSAVIRETDTAARDVLRILDETGRRKPNTATLVAADASLQHQQLRDAGLLWTLTRLQEMEQTVDIARTNARRHAPTCPTARTGDTLFARDDATLSWLVGQLDRDVKYLDALSRRATAVHAVASATVQGALAQRRDRLTILQTSLIGALVMALAGIQAFMYSPPVPERLQGPLICLLTVIAVALPLLIGRWTGVVPGGGPYRWTDLAAAIGLGAATGWFVSSTAWHLTADRPAPHPMTAAAVAAGALAVLLVTWLLGRSRDQPA